MSQDRGGRDAVKMMRMADPDSRQLDREGRELRAKYGDGPFVSAATNQMAMQVHNVFVPDARTQRREAAEEHAKYE